MQLSHPEARQARADAQKATEKNVKTASSAASKAASLIPGVGGLVSKGIGTARKGITAAMELRGTSYLPEEEQAADAMAAALLDATDASSCRALVDLLEEHIRARAENAWGVWLHTHPVSAERLQTLAESCPRVTSR
jgi:predicted Zn-dependent protease